jgi:hypothetical protein
MARIGRGMADDLITWLRAAMDETETDATFYIEHGATGPGLEWAQHALAEVDAKRRILDLHEGDHECSTIRRGVDCEGVPYEEIDNCTWVLDGDCSTVHLQALPYAAWPGYREDWRP